ncbi:isoprenyl transferase [Dysgonomonas sp. 25]|uniref:isoprenyl transferase n=1 Tax=Dysgonomonas sp. 25 TaxID=2302933 RepID=UPI0013D0E7CC|nr:isoprenyl transferase [Dysgonomonas sp. 25]NDV68656.1 isoprenyl transferase [Dysgonomonas sp. 25]
MSYFDQIDKNRIPEHIAIIMDGNGRWAKRQGLDRTEGHKEGLAAVKRTIEAASKLNASYVTLYTFSLENWKRPKEEVDALMMLMIKAVADETANMIENNVQLKAIGNLDMLPPKTRAALDKCIEDTSVSTGPSIILALSYSSKWELANAAKEIAVELKNGKIKEEDINEDLMAAHLTTKAFPDPDLLIRTGGELRISNFLLWQLAYAEFYFTDELWPEFNGESLYKAIVDYQNRERRYGKTSEQISTERKQEIN